MQNCKLLSEINIKKKSVANMTVLMITAIRRSVRATQLWFIFLNPMGSADSNDDDHHMQEVRKQIIMKQAKMIVLKIVCRAVTDSSKQSVDMPLTFTRLGKSSRKRSLCVNEGMKKKPASAQSKSVLFPLLPQRGKRDIWLAAQRILLQVDIFLAPAHTCTVITHLV